jgi:hypothetical protein
LVLRQALDRRRRDGSQHAEDDPVANHVGADADEDREPEPDRRGSEYDRHE